MNRLTPRSPTARPGGAIRLALALSCLGAALPGCEGTDESSSTAGPNPPPAQCPEGFQPLDATDECVPLLPAGDCPAGTMPLLGNGACQPVGWQGCPPGFTADPSGWGCRDILPPAPCAGATMDVLGQDTCRPIGDCSAPFPPPEATHFVDAAFADAELDATHFRGIQEALDAAASGAVIAVAPGIYPENLLMPGDVTVVGQCAEQVRIAGGLVMYPGVEVSAAGKVELRGLTISGYRSGIAVFGPGDADIRDVLLDGNENEGLVVYDGAAARVYTTAVRGTVESAPGAQTVGVFVFGGARVELHESALIANVDAGLGLIDPGTEAHLFGTVVRATAPRSDGVGGIGVKAFNGATLTLEGSALVTNQGMGMLVDGPGVTATVSTSVVRDTVMDPRFEGGLAWAISALGGSTLSITDSALLDNRVVGLSIADAGTTATATRLVVRGMQGTGYGGFGLGAIATRGAHLEIRASAVVESAGAAILVNNPDTFAIVEDSLVDATRGTGPTPDGPGGNGGSGLVVTAGGRAEARRVSFTRNAEAAVGVAGAGAALVLDASLVAGTAPNAGGFFGHGLVATTGGQTTISSSYFRDNIGIGLAFSAASGSLTGSFVLDNGVGIHVQDGVELHESNETMNPEPLSVLVSPSTKFLGNASRLGSGVVPLPATVDAAAL